MNKLQKKKMKKKTTRSDLLGAEPEVPHVVADGLGGRHGARQLPGLDDGGATLLHRLCRRNDDDKVRKLAVIWRARDENCGGRQQNC